MKNKTKLTACRIKYDILMPIMTIMIIGFVSVNSAEAHPHVFVDCSLTFEFDTHGLKGVRQKWWFDEMFAAMILGDFDKNHDNIFTPEEAKALEEGAFVNLKNFDYFTHIIVDGQPIKPVEAVQFKPTTEDGTLVYTFFVPLNLDNGKHEIKIAVFDESFYTSVQMDSENKVKGIPDNIKSVLSLEPVKEMAYFYDQMIPEAAVLTMSPR